jgi:hypothetical protein
MRARSFPAELGDDVRWIEVRNPPPTGRLRHRLEGRRAARIGADPDEPRLFRPGWIEREPRSLNAVVREHLDEEAMTALRRIEPCAREARAFCISDSASANDDASAIAATATRAAVRVFLIGDLPALMEVILGAEFAAGRQVQSKLSKFAVISCRSRIDGREQCAALDTIFDARGSGNGRRLWFSWKVFQ